MKKTKPHRMESAGRRARLLHRRWQRAVSALACLVVFCTAYALILPAITMEGTPYCGLEESEGHIHSEEAGCYTAQQLLSCTEPEHTHSEDCYDEEGNLVCTANEHTHGEDCYTTEQVLTCTLPEGGGHTHTEECYVNPDAAAEETTAAETTAEETAAEETTAEATTEEKTAAEESSEEESTEEESTEEESDAKPESSKAKTYTAGTGGYTVTVDVPAGAFDEEVALRVDPFGKESLSSAAKDLLVSEDLYENEAVFLEIGFYNADGVELEPGKAVSVTITAPGSKLPEGSLDVYHIKNEDGQRSLDKVDSLEREGNSGVTVDFKTDSFSVYAIIGTDPQNPSGTARATYNFVVGDETVDTQIVKNGEKLVEPEVPKDPEGKKFLGWYTESTGDEKFDFSKDVSVGESDVTVNLYARFGEICYVTFYDADNTKVAHVEEVGKGDTLSIETLNGITVQPTAGDMAFDGWKQEDGVKLTDDLRVTGNLSLYPVFVDAVVLTFDENGEGATKTASQYIKSGAATVKPADPQRQGYTFAGWYTAAEGGELFGFGSALSADTTLYAHWTASEANYTVVIWRQSINDDKDAETKTYDYAESVSISSTTGTQVSVPEGYTKYGNAGDYVGFHYSTCDNPKMVAFDGSTILNVYYDRNLITMKFEYSRYDTQEYTGLYGQLLSKYGYSWPSAGNRKRWQYNNDGTMTNMTFLNEFILPTPTNTLITFSTTDYNYENSITFSQESLDGSWVDVNSMNGTGRFTITDKYTGFAAYQYKVNRGSWTNVTKNSDGKYDFVEYENNLYIRFKRNSYNIDFMNGTTKVSTDSLKYEESLANAEKPNESSLTYPGNSADADYYEFVGWYKDPACTVEFDFAGTMPANNLVAYAKWAPKQVTVTFNPNGGSLPDGAGESVQVNYNYNATIGQITPTREGYTFLGWYVADKDGKATDTLWNFDDAVTKDMTLIAQWRYDDTMSVVYDLNGGEVSEGETITDDTAYTDGATAVVTNSQPTKEGSRFVGWQLGSTVYYPGDVINVTSDNDGLDGASDGKVTLTAVYTQVGTTTLVYDANDGEGTLTDLGNDNNTVTDIPLNADVTLSSGVGFTRNGYELIGWNTKADGTGTNFALGEKVALDNVDVSEEGWNVLYAVWRKSVDITVTKVSLSDRSTTLSGAEFVLYKTEDGDKQYYQYGNVGATWGNEEGAVTLTSGGDGTFSIHGLADGTYYLQETKAPDGYKKLTGPVTITVANGGVITVLENGVNVTPGQDKNGVYTFSVANSAGYELPHTGGSGIILLYSLGGMLILATAVGYGCILRRRREGRGA